MASAVRGDRVWQARCRLERRAREIFPSRKFFPSNFLSQRTRGAPRPGRRLTPLLLTHTPQVPPGGSTTHTHTSPVENTHKTHTTHGAIHFITRDFHRDTSGQAESRAGIVHHARMPRIVQSSKNFSFSQCVCVYDIKLISAPALSLHHYNARSSDHYFATS